ncbi:MAG: hypothetical protein AABY09_06090 [Nanoarchaeota archaeon]
MDDAIFDVGYGIEVKSRHCTKCYFNVTDETEMKRAISRLNSAKNNIKKQKSLKT